MIDIEKLLFDNSNTVEEALKRTLTDEYIGDTRLADAMRYAVLGGGKRIRAFLCRSFSALFGGASDASIPFAVAIELLHAYSLVHDDMPCMDDDDMRRGKPSTHVKFGEGQALLTGDTLLTLAFQIAIENPYVSERAARQAVSELARSAGALGMCGGQQLDLTCLAKSYDELKDLHKMKTGALISAACVMGAYSARDINEAELRSIKDYAYSVGLAFQIVDDILDVTSTPEILGKPIGSDADENKITVLSFMSISEARSEAKLLTEKAIDSIRSFDSSEVLIAFAEYLLNRDR